MDIDMISWAIYMLQPIFCHLLFCNMFSNCLVVMFKSKLNGDKTHTTAKNWQDWAFLFFTHDALLADIICGQPPITIFALVLLSDHPLNI